MRIKHFILFISLLVFTGCNSQFIHTPIEYTYPFSFSHFIIKDPNNIGEEYSQRIKKYNDILASSSVPIFIMDQEDLPEELKKSIKLKNIDRVSGLYFSNSKYKTMPHRFIFINKENSPELIMITFFHEYQHYLCEISGCYCNKDNFLPEDERIIYSIFGEKHAIENELRRSLELKDINLIKTSILSISNYILHDQSCTYKMASTCIINKDLWNKSIEFLLNR